MQFELEDPMLKKVLVASVVGAVVVSSGCSKVDPNSPVQQRKTIFKKMVKTNEELGGMVRGRIAFDAKRFQSLSETLSDLSRQPWPLFVEFNAAASGEKTMAADALWHDKAGFEREQTHFVEMVAQLKTAAGSGKLDVVRPAFQAVEASCKQCHKAYRTE